MDCALGGPRRPRPHRAHAPGARPATWWSWAATACGCRRRRTPATPRCSSSWPRRCRPRSPRRCSSPGWPTGCGPHAIGAGRCWSSAGPAVVHTGGAPDLARLVSTPAGSTCSSPGNGFATHDIEANVLGTSLGVSVAEGMPTEGGHANHLRVINEVRRHGSIARRRRGRVRDRRRDARVRQAPGCRSCWAGRSGTTARCPTSSPTPSRPPTPCASTSPGRARSRSCWPRRCTPSPPATACRPGVETFCVDINQAVVTKLADRGSHQALGIVTDVGLFVRQLADHLLGPR